MRLANYSNSSQPKHKERDRLDWSTTVLFLLTYMNDTQSALRPECQSVEQGVENEISNSLLLIPDHSLEEVYI